LIKERRQIKRLDKRIEKLKEGSIDECVALMGDLEFVKKEDE
jgi:hypothetical protein